MYDYPGRFKSAHGQNFARWQMDGWRNNAETARGMSRSPEIWPGRRIVLTGYLKAIHRTDNGIQTLATYEQDARGRLTEADARLDYHLFYEYDAADRIIRWSDTATIKTRCSSQKSLTRRASHTVIFWTTVAG
ncbi:hypothetical protein J4872_004983 [Escherichia coli]|nr:hypothetical protein [Escherichia coli]EHC1902051.1 hypothetical protein [Escherichia coli]EHH4339845.1 hypothetical protein [Escherichia coli]EIN4320495.1 hypothetical protein [Escherichia coli]EJI3253735.1 hypothetical protein [Escherichia coli]